MADSKIPKVFISSTLEDLADFRQAAQDAILRLGWQPINCHYWAAGGHPPLATCLEKVDAAAVVVAIVAHRHGWTPQDPPGDGKKSITRLECERAKALGKEVIPFLVDERARWDAKLAEAHRITETEPEKIAEVAGEVGRNVQALREFKAWLNTIGTRVQFATPDQLETEILHALTEWGQRHGMTGVAVPGEADRAKLRVTYLRLLAGEWRTMPLEVLDKRSAEPAARRLTLEQVYVALNVTTPRPRSLHVEGRADHEQPPLGAVEALCRAEWRRMVLLGPPGSGKPQP